MQRFYWSNEEYESDLAYEAATREWNRHAWTVDTLNGPTVLQTGAQWVDIEHPGQPDRPLYRVERASAAARFRAWRRGGIRIRRGLHIGVQLTKQP